MPPELSFNVVNVLLVDESAECELFETEMKLLGLHHTFIHAESGNAMFEILNGNASIDLIIVEADIVENGVESVREIKKIRPEVAVVVFTSKVVHIDKAFSYGAHFYAVKPYYQRNHLMTLQKIFAVDWKNPGVPARDQFLIDLAYS